MSLTSYWCDAACAVEPGAHCPWAGLSAGCMCSGAMGTACWRVCAATSGSPLGSVCRGQQRGKSLRLSCLSTCARRTMLKNQVRGFLLAAGSGERLVLQLQQVLHAPATCLAGAAVPHPVPIYQLGPRPCPAGRNPYAPALPCDSPPREPVPGNDQRCRCCGGWNSRVCATGCAGASLVRRVTLPTAETTAEQLEEREMSMLQCWKAIEANTARRLSPTGCYGRPMDRSAAAATSAN